MGMHASRSTHDKFAIFDPLIRPDQIDYLFLGHSSSKFYEYLLTTMNIIKLIQLFFLFSHV